MPEHPKFLDLPLAVEIERDGDGDVVRVVRAGYEFRGVGYHVALVYGHGGDADHDPERMEYARLFAEAPRLYALAQRIADHFEGTDAPLGAEARAALAAVRGEV